MLDRPVFAKVVKIHFNDKHLPTDHQRHLHDIAHNKALHGSHGDNVSYAGRLLYPFKQLTPFKIVSGPPYVIVQDFADSPRK